MKAICHVSRIVAFWLACTSLLLAQGSAEKKDTDGDGIPDVWETKCGLDPNDPADAATLEAVHSKGLAAIRSGATSLPTGFVASVRWLYEVDPETFPVADFLAYEEYPDLVATARAALDEKKLTPRETRTIIRQFGALSDTGKVSTVSLLMHNDSPEVREFLLSPAFRQSIKNPRTLDLMKDDITMLREKILAEQVANIKSPPAVEPPRRLPLVAPWFIGALAIFGAIIVIKTFLRQ